MARSRRPPKGALQIPWLRSELVTCMIFSCFLHIQPVVFKLPDKAVILSVAPSQMDRVTQHLWRGVERTPRVFIRSILSEALQPQKPAPGGGPRCSPGDPVHTAARISFSSLGGRKAPYSIDRIKALGVLRLRARSAVSRDPSVSAALRMTIWCSPVHARPPKGALQITWLRSEAVTFRSFRVFCIFNELYSKSPTKSSS